jgi:RNA polymerase sigma factor (sigma-70 family)
MDRLGARSKGVNQAIAEPVALPKSHAEPERFAALYERTFSRVYAYVCSMLRDPAAAEDVTAQAYERAYRKRRTYRPGRGSADAWLFGIARNAALDELRRKKRHAGLHADPQDEVAPGVDEQAEEALRRQALAQAMTRLDPRERELVALKFMAGLTNVEIARVLDLSESNISTKLHRTITKLREACRDQA